MAKNPFVRQPEKKNWLMERLKKAPAEKALATSSSADAARRPGSQAYDARPAGKRKGVQVKKSRAPALSPTSEALRNAFNQLDDVLLRLADLAPKQKISCESADAYWRYLREHMAKHATLPKEVAQERRNPLVSSLIDDEGKKFARSFAVGLETIEDSGRWPAFKSIQSVLQNLFDYDNIDKIIFYYLNDFLGRLLSDEKEPLQRVYRRRAELPDPTQPANAEVNLPKQQVKLRLFPSMIEAITQARGQAGEGQQQFVARALLQRLEHEFPDIYQELMESESFAYKHPNAKPELDGD